MLNVFRQRTILISRTHSSIVILAFALEVHPSKLFTKY